MNVLILKDNNFDADLVTIMKSYIQVFMKKKKTKHMKYLSKKLTISGMNSPPVQKAKNAKNKK